MTDSSIDPPSDDASAKDRKPNKPKGGARVLRLPSRHGQVLEIGGMRMPASAFDEGEALIIENGIDAEGQMNDPNWPEYGRQGAREAYAVACGMMRERCLARDLADLEANDRDNAERLLARYPHDLIMVRNKGFHAWNGRIYDSETADPRSFHLAGETAKAIHAEARFVSAPDKDSEGKAREARRRFAKTSGNHRSQVAMLEQVGKKRSFSVDDLDRDPLLIVVRNGTIRLRRPAKDGKDDDTPLIEFTPHHDPADFATHWIDADYIEGAPCPRWRSFLERTQPDKEQRLFLQTFAGYCLTGLMDWQGFVIHYGTGANGKSVYGDAIGKILGSACVSVSPESFLARNQRQGDKASPDLVRLVGKRCVQIFEYKEAEPLDEAALKRITGGDKMVVRGLHKDPIEFRPRFKIEIFANEKPRIKGTYEGIWRRIHLLNWPVKIPDAEKREPSELQAEFDEERSGILNYVLDGAMHFIEYGLKVPESIRAATAEYRDDSDPVGLFIRDCIEEASGQRVSGAYMYDSFGRWCDANGVRRMAVQHFAPKMLEHGMVRARSNGSMWLDVRLHDVPQPDLMDPPSPD